MTVLALVVPVLGACSTSGWQARAVSVPAGNGVQDSAVPAYQRGKAYLTAGNFGLALEAFNEAQRTAPDSVATLNAVAITYGKLGRLDVARRYFDRALAVAPDQPATLNNLGRALLEHDHASEALTFFERALELERDNPVIAANAATARRRVAERRAALRIAEAGHVKAAPTTWIERSSARLQTLITDGLAPAGGKAMDPRLVNVFGARAAIAGGVSVDRGAPGAPEKKGLPASWPRLEVSNGAGRRHMAARMQRHLADHGLEVDRLTNADSFGYRQSAILYHPRFKVLAAELAHALPFAPPLQEDSNQLSAVRLRLGADLLDFDATLPRLS